MPNATQTALEGLRKRDLISFLESDPRVREWLAGPDRDLHGDGEVTPGAMIAGNGALLTSKEAAGELGVERSRIWRWENAGRIARAQSTNATPLYMRADVMKLKAELDEAERAKREAEAAEA